MAFLSIWMDFFGRSSETNCLQIQLDVCGGQLKLTGGIASCLQGGPNNYQMDSFAVDQKLLISSLISSCVIWSFFCSSFHRPRRQVVVVGSFAYVFGRSQSEKLEKLQAQVLGDFLCLLFHHVIWIFTILPLLLSIGFFTIATTAILLGCLLLLNSCSDFSIFFLGRFPLVTK